MLINPAVVTIGGVAHNLARINWDNFGSVYLKKAALLEIKLTVRNSYEGKAGPGQMERHNVELVYTTFDATTLEPSSITYYTVLRFKRGLGVQTPADVASGLNAFLTNAIMVDIGTWGS